MNTRTPGQRQTELDQYKALNLAALEFGRMKSNDRIIVNDEDFVAMYFEQQKRLIEKYHADRKLQRLKEKFEEFARNGYGRFAEYEDYLKRSTGLQADAFERIRVKAAEILARNVIGGKRESDLLHTAIMYYRDTGNREMASRLQDLLSRHRPSPQSDIGWQESNVEVMEDGSLKISVTAYTGAKPVSYHKREIPSPGGKRKLVIIQHEGRGRSNTYTEVQLHFPHNTCGIYSTPGLHPGIRVSWKDEDTILIEKEKSFQPHTGVRKIQYDDNVVLVEYIEN